MAGNQDDPSAGRPPFPFAPPARPPHPATVVQKKPVIGKPAARPPHPATVAQPKPAFGAPAARPPHPANVARQYRAASSIQRADVLSGQSGGGGSGKSDGTGSGGSGGDDKKKDGGSGSGGSGSGLNKNAKEFVVRQIVDLRPALEQQNDLITWATYQGWVRAIVNLPAAWQRIDVTHGWHAGAFGDAAHFDIRIDNGLTQHVYLGVLFNGLPYLYIG